MGHRVALSELLSSLPHRDRQDRFIHKVLMGLNSEGHTDLERDTLLSWDTILSPEHSNHLYLIVSGNASIAFAARLGGDGASFTEMLADIPGGMSPVETLNKEAIAHPLVLCKGDLIGEFEYVQKRRPMSHVIAGTFFKAPETRKRLQTITLKMPPESAFVKTVCLHAMTEKLLLLSQLVLPSIHRTEDRVNHTLACCFAGLFPVYRAFYCDMEEGEMPDSCTGVPIEKDKKTTFAGLARLNPARRPIGIEISTSYLTRCFGLSADSFARDVELRELDVYSGKKQHQKIKHLGAESLLLFLRRKTAEQFCSKYGVDQQHSLLGDALEAYQ